MYECCTSADHDTQALHPRQCLRAQRRLERPGRRGLAPERIRSRVHGALVAERRNSTGLLWFELLDPIITRAMPCELMVVSKVAEEVRLRNGEYVVQRCIKTLGDSIAEESH